VRLFVAAEIDPQLARDLARVSGEIRQRVDVRAPRAKLTWVPPERLHFTVHFIGQVAAADVEAIKAALAPPLSVSPFTLAVAGIGTFPGRGTLRVLWAGCGEGREALIAVADEVKERLRDFRLKPEATYTPHLTLARVRDAAGLRTADLAADAATPFGTTRVDAITLFESRLSPKGSQYVRVQSTALRPHIED
jgi:RNA 2',3'-cyclic 3'-phosphodiesterase